MVLATCNSEGFLWPLFGAQALVLIHVNGRLALDRGLLQRLDKATIVRPP